MKKTNLILSLIAAGGLVAFSAQALDLSKVKVPGKNNTSTTSTSTSTSPATYGSDSKLNEVRKDLKGMVGKPGDEALATLRKKYGKEKRYNLQSYYWSIPSDDGSGQCIEFSILVNGPNVGNQKSHQGPCE